MALNFTRREFVSIAACGFAAHIVASAELKSGKVVLYVSDGSELIRYDVDVAAATLSRMGPITMPSAVQYVWPHASRRGLYVACSDHVKSHWLIVLMIDGHTGALSELGARVALPERPIHLSTDIPSQYVLVAFNEPANVRVYRIRKDLTVGEEVPQPGLTDRGIFAHQIRVTPDNQHAILVTRGVSATANKPEDPGALKVFDYKDGVLSNETSIAPNHGYGFGPRHLDFHPTRPWLYVSLERESKLFMYRLNNGRITEDAVYQKETLTDPSTVGPRQLAGAIHMHPSGRFVYVSNRFDGTEEFQGKQVLASGENSVVVYEIDQTTGEPTAIQHVDTRKVHPRTFSLDPSARLMTVQNINLEYVRDADEVRQEAAGITVFRIGEDGKLTYQRGYDTPVQGSDTILWGGMIGLP